MNPLAQQTLARMRAAESEDDAEEFKSAFAVADAVESPVAKWIRKLPRNVTVGLLDAAVNTVDFMEDVGDKLGAAESKVGTGDVSDFDQSEPTGPPPRFADTDVAQAVHGFREYLAANGDTGDEITQGVAQFAIPFTGWAKALGVARGLPLWSNFTRAAGAEAVASSTVLPADAGRLMDLVELGRHSEGKFGEALNALSPDGSLANQYINWMTAREGDSEWEGRFKNTVDSLGASTAIAGFIKTAAGTYRVMRDLPGYVAGLEPKVAGTPGAQKGQIAFHGTAQESIEKFDINKVGTGQGAQTFGHGLYFAENPKTAGHYREMLSRDPSPGMDEALAALRAAKGDKTRAIDALNRLIKREPNDLVQEQYREGIRLIEAGEAREHGALYTVDIPDDAVSQMIDYDSYMSKQPGVLEKIPAKVRENLEGMLEDAGYVPELESLTGNEFYQLVGKGIRDDAIVYNPSDGNFDNVKKLTSEYLNSIGIPGIRYFDKGSRAKGDGTRNLVLFDDKLVKILKKE